ncbi:MAG TPA: protein kinase, partial [Candidatus Acidoferrales bacterium]|nr:protein kinase [Candidatus Acidoferrales bacterium]
MKSCPHCKSTYPTQFTVCPHDAATLQEVSELEPGAILRGKYKILEKIGEGGMGAVYKALHVKFNEVCALKIVLPYHLKDPSFLQRFNAEAVLMRRLDHPHALHINDVDETEDGRPFFVMEYIEGESLDAVLARGALAPARAVGIAIQACEALAAAHRLGVIHRDIKPANLILARTADGSDCVKVLDFGIAKVKAGSPLRDGASLTQTGALVGTPTYMSPEQCQGAHGDKLTESSDLYSLGVVLYQMLTGSVPFKADTAVGMLMAHLQQSPPDPRVLCPSVPPQVVNVVFRALEKDPTKRFASADEMRKALEDANAALGKTTVGSLRAVKLEPAVTPPAPPPAEPLPVAPPPSTPAPAERIVAPPPQPPQPALQPQAAPQPVRAAAAPPAVPEPAIRTSRPRTNPWLIFGGGAALLAILVLLAVLVARTGRMDRSKSPEVERPPGSSAGSTANAKGLAESPETEARKSPSPAALVPPVAEKPKPAPESKPAEGPAAPRTEPNPTPPEPRALTPVVIPQFALLETLVGHAESVLSVAFSPNGRLLASGSSDNTINLWDVSSGRSVRQLIGHKGQVFGVAFSPNGAMLASASADHTVKLWDVAGGRELVTFAGHTDKVYSVA